MFSVTSYSLSHSAPATGAPRAVLALVMENHGIALDRRGFNGIQKRYPKINGMEQTNAISSQRIGNHFQNHLCFNLHACLISPCRLCWSWIFGILRGLRMLLVIFGCNTVLIQSNINWLWLIYSWTNFLGPTWTAAPPRIILTYMAYCGHAIGWALGDMFIFVNFNKHDLWDHDSETPTSQPAEAMMLWSTVLTRNPWETILVRHPRAKCIMCLSKYCIYRMATFMHCHCKWYNMITFHICWWYWLSDHCLSQRHASLVRAGGWWWRLPWKPRALRWTSYQFISMKSQSFLDASTGSITFFFFRFGPLAAMPLNRRQTSSESLERIELLKDWTPPVINLKFRYVLISSFTGWFGHIAHLSMMFSCDSFCEPGLFWRSQHPRKRWSAEEGNQTCQR